MNFIFAKILALFAIFFYFKTNKLFLQNMKFHNFTTNPCFPKKKGKIVFPIITESIECMLVGNKSDLHLSRQISRSEYRVTSYTWSCCWYLVNSDLSSVRVTEVYIGQVNFYKVPEKHGHVYLVRLYKKNSY